MVEESCPELLVGPWIKRHKLLQKFFKSALDRYDDPQAKRLSDRLRSLVLPALSTTLRVSVSC